MYPQDPTPQTPDPRPIAPDPAPQTLNPITLRTQSGAISWTQVTNIAFLVLWCAIQLANAFGFQSYEPPAEALVIMLAAAIVNMLIRKYHTKEPMG
jgi:hypothetical protein